MLLFVGCGAPASPGQDAGALDAGGCQAPVSYGAALESQTAKYFTGAPSPGTYDLTAQLGDSGTAADFLIVQLYPGSGVFTGAVQPGSYVLSGSETQWKDCGVCVLVFADAVFGPDGGVSSVASVYMATGGLVKLDSITPHLSGSLQGLTFQKVVVGAGFETTPAGDGCTTSLAMATFDAGVEQL